MHEITSIGFIPTTSHYHIEGTSCSHNAEGSRRKEGVEGRFITVSKDGTMCVWSNNLTLQKVIVVSRKFSFYL